MTHILRALEKPLACCYTVSMRLLDVPLGMYSSPAARAFPDNLRDASLFENQYGKYVAMILWSSSKDLNN